MYLGPQTRATNVPKLRAWRKNAIVNKTKQVLSLAATKYQAPNIRFCNIRFDLKGKAAGQAICGAYDETLLRKPFTIKYNHEALNRSDIFRGVFSEVIPHEIAHIVAMDLEWDTVHGKTWKAACIELGGTGAAKHFMCLNPASKKPLYLYRTAAGTEIYISLRDHAKIQTSRKRTIKRRIVETREIIEKGHFIKEVPHDYPVTNKLFLET